MHSLSSKYVLLRRIVWILLLVQTLHGISCENPSLDSRTEELTEAGKFSESMKTSESREFSEYGEFSESGNFQELGTLAGPSENNATTEFAEEEKIIDASDFTGVNTTDQRVILQNWTRTNVLDLFLSGAQINETTLRDDIYNNALHLRSISINQAPNLRRLPKLCDLPKLRTIRIINSGLEDIPNLQKIHGTNKNSLLQMIDFEGNQIKNIPTLTFDVRADQLILDHNQIEEISAFAFKHSELSELSLKGNSRLTRLHAQAFADVKMIRQLDLSGTSITTMPSLGLERLEVLRIENVPSLRIIPSVYDFQHLNAAWLTHHFHCCAFKFPDIHDPVRHAEYKKHIANMHQKCEKKKSQAAKRHKRHVPATKTQKLDKDITQRAHTSNIQWGHIVGEDISSEEMSNESSEYVDRKPYNGFNSVSDESDQFQGWDTSGLDDPLESSEDEVTSPPSAYGTFHKAEVILDHKNIEAFCGNITKRRPSVICSPEPDPLNPCEDVMGWRWLRLSVWLVVAAAVVGNAAVALVLLSNRAELTVPKMLMCHLAFADLCTGFYLLMLASIDVASYGEYFNYAYDWQYGTGCKIAGFLSVFSGQLSVYALGVITLERWFAITFAIYLNRRIDLKAAIRIMIGGWIFALTMAGLPLVGVSDYSSTSICLPAENKNATDGAYQAILFATSATGFAVIVVCYVQIYRSLGADTRRNSLQSNDRSIAKKMSLLVATDFLCWAPVAFFGVTALAGYPMVDVSHSKVLLVFFYPLNACANPFLYAILTQQYQRDFVFLLARYGLCTKMAQKYKMGYTLPTTNHSNPVPLIPRATLETSISKDLMPNAVAEETL